MPDPTDDQIHAAVFDALITSDGLVPGWSALTATSIASQLIPTIRALIDGARDTTPEGPHA